jgi:hypothetical protein
MSSKSQRVSKAAIIADEVSALAQYCPDLENWPQIWSFDERDIAPGKRIVEFFRPFLFHLLSQGLATKTLRRHRDHLWMLGGEVIRRRQENSTLRRLAVEKVTFALLEEDGGPLIWPRISEQEQDAFDATCRKFYRHLTATENTNK